MTALGDLDRARIGEPCAQELARFRADRPRSIAMISRARAHMPNGVPMAWMASDYDQPVYIDHGRGAGPTVPVPAARADVTRYLEAYHDLLARLD